jgi:hypothetical protein
MAISHKVGPSDTEAARGTVAACREELSDTIENVKPGSKGTVAACREELSDTIENVKPGSWRPWTRPLGGPKVKPSDTIENVKDTIRTMKAIMCDP